MDLAVGLPVQGLISQVTLPATGSPATPVADHITSTASGRMQPRMREIRAAKTASRLRAGFNHVGV